MLISCRWLLCTFWIAAISSKSLEDDHYSQQQKEEKRPFDPLQTTRAKRAKSPTFDFPPWLKYPFSENRRLE
jgi:hypothetical protein